MPLAGPIRVPRPSRGDLRHALLTLFTLAASAVGEDVTLSKGDDCFTIATPIYRAQINAKTGMLEQMMIDGTTVIEKVTVNLYGRPITGTAVTQESPTVVVTCISAEDDKQVVGQALRVTYAAQASILTVKVLASVKGQVAGSGPSFDLGKEAQMVRSLEFKETIPMPVMQWRSPWMRVKFHYANGATLGILNEGAGNPINPNENGGVHGFTYRRSGYVPNSEYVYTLIAEKGGKRTLGAPPMKIVESDTPAVYWQGDPVLATLRIARKDTEKLAGLKGLRLKFEVQDAFEQVAARGEVPLDLSASGDPIERRVPLGIARLGWYRAYFTVNDADNSLLEGKERLIFSVLKHLPNMGERFDNVFQTNYTIGLGLWRLPATDNLKQLEKWAEEAKGTDVLPTYAIDGSPVGNDPKKFGEWVYDLFSKAKDTIPRVEIINEPNGNYQPKEYIDTFLRPAYESIKKASPNTKVLSPVLCGISDEQVQYLANLYKLGFKDLCDELTFHPYGGNFDDGWAVPCMQKLLDVIAANGDSAKPVHFTEGGYGHGGWSHLGLLREIIKHAVTQYVWQNAVMGIDHQHNMYYFTDQMGYLDMWLRSNQLTPAAVALRTYTGMVKSQRRAQPMSFGSLEVVRAFRYPGPERQVIVLWTSCNWIPDPASDAVTRVTLETDVEKVEWWDCFGNPIPVQVTQGKIGLDVGSYPSYLVVPSQAKVNPMVERWGPNLALAALGATAESTSEMGTLPAVSAIDGNMASGSCWRSLTPNDLPQSITVTLAGPAPIDRVGLWSYSARGYDIETMGADGQWQKLVSKRDQPHRRFRNEPFPAVTTDQIRLTVVDSSSDRAEVAELQVFSSGATAGKATELVNWALKTNGATAKASSEMTKDVTVAVQDWGAKQPRISQVKLEARAENAIDGKRLVGHWREFFPTTWMAAPGAALPQWLEVDLAKPRTITSIAVFTIAFANWTPADSGIRDWDVQVWDGKDWKTVDAVTANTRVSKISRLKPPVTTDRVRVLVKATNDPEGTVGLMEVQAYGPAE